jgi:DNA uptake protein ComE-like DNA-binding protein
MNYLKSQTNTFQIRLGFALVALGGALTVLSPLFFMILVPVGAYSLVLGFSTRIKSKSLRIGAIVPAAIFLASIFGAATTATINPESLETEEPSSQVSQIETPQPEASVSTPAASPTTTTAPAASPAAPAAPAQPSSNCQAGQVDINTAPEEQLMTIIHIGTTRVAELVSLRPYRSIEGLDNISGIGDVRMAEIRAQGIACVG